MIRDDPAALDSPLSSLVKRCLAKRPQERYSGMAEVQIALENAALEKIASKPAPSQQPSVAVLPFANMSGDTGLGLP